jgi:hypothetical protein
MPNVFSFIFASVLAKNAGAEQSDATRIGAACSMVPPIIGLVAAVALGRAAAPPPPAPAKATGKEK